LRAIPGATSRLSKNCVFNSLLTSAFAFLPTEFGFALKIFDATQGQAAYAKDPLSIEFWWGNGQLDINFCIALEYAKTHAVFRPYLTRTFDLFRVVSKIDPAYLKSHPASGDYIDTPKQIAQHLEYSATVMRQYCATILRGDFSVLEAMLGR
jgi:hypothetical protein